MTLQNPVRQTQKSYLYEWYVVAICMLAYIFSFIDRQILTLMIEPIKHDMQLSDTQFSLLHGLAFSLFYAFMGMPIAVLADRYSRPRIIVIGITFWSLATAACGMAHNFMHMFLARIGVGIGEAALSPAAYSMMSDMFERHKLGRAVAVYSLGSFLGGGIAFLLGGYVIDLVKNMSMINLPVLGETRPWQVTFFLVGLPGVLVALAIALTVRDPARKALKLGVDGQVQTASLRDTFRFLNQHRKTFICHYIGFSFYAMTLFCLLGWAPAFYMRRFGLDPAHTGYLLGMLILLANTSGVLFGGVLIDWLTRRGYTDAPMRAGVIGATCMLLPAVMFTQMPSVNLSLAVLAVAMFFASFPMPASTAVMQILPPNQMRAQVSALFLLISNLIGLGLGTTAVALLTDRLFHDPLQVGSSISLINAGASVLAIVLLGIGCKAYRASLIDEGRG